VTCRQAPSRERALEVTTASRNRVLSVLSGPSTRGSGRSTVRRWAVTTSFSSAVQRSRSVRLSVVP
jgi:hypothetical protein